MIAAHVGPGYGEFKVDTESIFERMSRARPRAASAVVNHGNPAAWHGQKASTCVPCASDADVLAGLLGALDAHAFLFGRMTALADARGCTPLFLFPLPVVSCVLTRDFEM